MRADNMEKTKKKRLISLWVCLPLFLAAAACVIGLLYVTRMLESQYEYERWRGDNEDRFSQISCFMPSDGKLTLENIYGFRTAMMNKLTEASIEKPETQFTDCWSAQGSATVSGDRNGGNASVIAVGGNYFAFHPLRLVNGSYINESDLMKDNILLDEELAWMLFGGNNLTGMTVYLFNIPFRIAGVVAREGDFASEKAYTAGPGLFMSYDAYIACSGDEKAGISCYEFVMPDPVKNFALGFAQSKFPIGSGEILENTGRFSFLKLISIAKDPATRVLRGGADYPYWENAARYAENKAATLLVLTIVFALGPEVILLAALIRHLSWGKEKLNEEIIPEAQERLEESIRVRQRKRWEKQHQKS